MRSIHIALSFLVFLISIPVLAAGDDFYCCTRRDGSMVITNRQKASDWVKCQPFELNRDFRAAEKRRRNEPVSFRFGRDLEETAQAARTSAEAARTSAEAARNAALAAGAAAYASIISSSPPPEPNYLSQYWNWRR